MTKPFRLSAVLLMLVTQAYSQTSINSSSGNYVYVYNAGLATNAPSGSVELRLNTTSDGWGAKLSTYKETSNTAGLAFFTQFGWTTPVERMRITSTGNVGIGTSFTSSTLSIRNTQLADDAASGMVDLSFRTTSGEWGTKIAAFKESSNTAGMSFYTQYGWTAPFERMRITSTGNLLIGKTSQLNSSYKVDVAGSIRSNEIVVNVTGADFVFDPSYNLPSLDEVEKFIQTNRHLPDIESAEEMQTNGIAVGKTEVKLLQKIEELTLHLIRQEKEIKELKAKLKEN
ncbi:hypothetical protein WBG78_28950 [Chryseolinea sp. T2]|uniref:hypothetical protein n=1 Tax=Chryseolinea sp. T2 TaxID=3129255 RepID=UPI0030786126